MLLHALTDLSFEFLSSISLYEYTTICLSICLLMAMWVVHNFGLFELILRLKISWTFSRNNLYQVKL